MVPWPNRNITKPDRVFSTSGKGTKGAVTEYRYGLQAKIGLDYDCGLGVKHAFVLPALAAYSSSQSTGYDLLLSLPDRTRVLRLSEDLGDISELEAENGAGYDASSRTVSAVVANDSPDVIVQVTEQNIVLINASQV